MSAEKKLFPRTVEDRFKALEAAWKQNDQMGVNSILSLKTRDRLINIFPLYRNKMQMRQVRKMHYSKLALQKRQAQDTCAQYCSHFFQVLNLCIARGEFKASDRAAFGLPVENTAVPRPATGIQVLLQAQDIIKGEAIRAAAGGVPMSNPSAAQVEAKLNLFKPLFQQAGNARDAYDAAQEDLAALNKEANAVIKKVWAEVKSFYNEHSRPSMREHARWWGVIYERSGRTKKLTGTVTDALTHEPLQGVTLMFTSGRNKTLSDTYGRFALSTTLMNEQTLTAKLTGYQPMRVTVTLTEGKGAVAEVKMVKEE